MEDSVRASSDPRGRTECERRQPHDIFVPSQVTGLTHLRERLRAASFALCSQQLSVLTRVISKVKCMAKILCLLADVDDKVYCRRILT